MKSINDRNSQDHGQVVSDVNVNRNAIRTTNMIFNLRNSLVIAICHRTAIFSRTLQARHERRISTGQIGRATRITITACSNGAANVLLYPRNRAVHTHRQEILGSYAGLHASGTTNLQIILITSRRILFRPIRQAVQSGQIMMTGQGRNVRPRHTKRRPIRRVTRPRRQSSIRGLQRCVNRHSCSTKSYVMSNYTLGVSRRAANRATCTECQGVYCLTIHGLNIPMSATNGYAHNRIKEVFFIRNRRALGVRIGVCLSRYR